MEAYKKKIIGMDFKEEDYKKQIQGFKDMIEAMQGEMKE